VEETEMKRERIDQYEPIKLTPISLEVQRLLDQADELAEQRRLFKFKKEQQDDHAK
jgi:hypothetical protein